MNTYDLIIEAKKEIDEICTYDNYVKAKDKFREQYDEHIKRLKESEVEE